VAFGSTDPDVLSSLAGRLARMAKQIGQEDQRRIADIAGGQPLQVITAAIVEALDPDRQVEVARAANGLPIDAEPTPAQVEQAARDLLRTAAAPLGGNPALRDLIIDVKQRFEQTLDAISVDEVLEAGFSEDARERAQTLVTSFEQFIRENKDEITAIQALYSKPYGQRLTFADLKALADALQAPPRSWLPEKLWRAYETLDQSKVRGTWSMLTDIVSLVRFALHEEDELVPFSDEVEHRFEGWLAMQETAGRIFTAEQKSWLALIKDQIAAGLTVSASDFDEAPFAQRGGIGKAFQVFGDDWAKVLAELNVELIQ
jgi:type I restriction enzyme R subunit